MSITWPFQGKHTQVNSEVQVCQWSLAWTFLTPELRGKPKEIFDKQTHTDQALQEPPAESSSHFVHIMPLEGTWETIWTAVPSALFPMNRLLAFGKGKARPWVWKMRILLVSSKENPDFQMSHWDITQKASHYFNSDVFSEYPLVICFQKNEKMMLLEMSSACYAEAKSKCSLC